MSNQNVVVLQGNLVEDPQTFRKDDTVVTRFTLAVNNGFGENRSTTFIDCVAFGKQAEVIEKYLTKGRQVVVNGSLYQSRWEKDGQKRSRHEIRLNGINGFSFAGSRIADEEETAAVPTQEKLF
jgi:single-strand DNA-binding protein